MSEKKKEKEKEKVKEVAAEHSGASGEREREMDGVGSRLGRASSRYGPAPVFNGPVRRWKKKWVHVPSSSSSRHSSTTTSFRSSSNDHNAPAVRLPRWTPISSPSLSSGDSLMSEEPPRRKLRYTPIAVLEEKKKNTAKESGYVSSASKANRSTARETTDNYDVEKSPVDDIFTEGIQTSGKSGAAHKHLNRTPMDLDLSLNGRDSDNDSDGENKEPDWGTANQN